MATIDQQFIEFIVKTLVSKPDEVKVDRTRGATAQSIRTLLRVLGTKNGARYNLKIINTDDYEAAPRAESHDATELAEDKAEMAAGAAVEEEINEQEDDSSDLAEKTRAELADLDDLDI